MNILAPQRPTIAIGLEIVKQLVTFKQNASIPALILGLLEMVEQTMGKESAVETAREQINQMADFIDVDKLAKLLMDQDKCMLLMMNQLPKDIDEEQSLNNYRVQAQELIDQLHANPDYDLALHTKFLGQVEKSLRDYVVKNTKLS